MLKIKPLKSEFSSDRNKIAKIKNSNRGLSSMELYDD